MCNWKMSDENEFLNVWLDGVLKLCLACFGLFINSIAIWILVTEKKMQRMFLHILTSSFLVDNGYMLMEILASLYYEYKITALGWILPHFTFWNICKKFYWLFSKVFDLKRFTANGLWKIYAIWSLLNHCKSSLVDT